MAEPVEPGEGFELTRIFDAPRNRVWREWTTPESFADWFGGPDFEVPIESVSWEPEPGAGWRCTMLGGGREIQWEGEFREVVEPERLVFTVTDQPGNPERDVVTVVLVDAGDDRTEMRFSQTGGGLPPEGYERAKQGWGVFFERIDQLLEANA